MYLPSHIGRYLSFSLWRNKGHATTTSFTLILEIAPLFIHLGRIVYLQYSFSSGYISYERWRNGAGELEKGTLTPFRIHC